MQSKQSRHQRAQQQAVDSPDGIHREIVLHLERLKALAATLQTAAASDAVRTQARDLVAFFTGPSRNHNYEEERLVFPSLLAGSDAAVHRTVERLREEHAWIELQWLDIEVQLLTLAQGDVPGDLQNLNGAVDDFARLLHVHMALEESAIYPHIRARLLT